MLFLQPFPGNLIRKGQISFDDSIRRKETKEEEEIAEGGRKYYPHHTAE